MSMLEVKDLEVNYGMIKAIKGVSFHVEAGEIVALIGAIGGGKTTILHTISGLIPAAAGSIVFEGNDVRRIPGYKLTGLGMAHVPEGRRVFAEMTVLQNLRLGAYTRKDSAETEETLEMIYQHFPRLKERRSQLAGTLSGGEQQMLAMGRALMSKPTMILMDEPSMGLSPLLVKEVFSIIEFCHSQGITILLVEQNARMALNIADRAYVLEVGKISMEGKANELLESEAIKKAYLGG